MANLELLNTTLAKFQGITLDRVARSLRFRTMHTLARFEPVRVVTGLGRHTPKHPVSEHLLEGAVDRSIMDLKRAGIALGLTLRPEVVDEIHAWANANPCYGNLRPSWGFYHPEREAAQERAGSKFTVAHYFNTNASPTIRRLAADPLFEEVAKRYVGPRAKFISTHMWWSFPNDLSVADRNTYAQLFHFDLDDYRFVKFFFYLTDVDEESGPHVYVRGSHKGKKLRDMFPMRRFSDDEVMAKWGQSNITRVVGPRGSGFAADTFGIHKGEPPRTKQRLLIQFLWGQSEWGFGTDVVPLGDLSML